MDTKLVKEYLLETKKIDCNDLYSILDLLTGSNLDYGDLYFQSIYHEYWVLENGIIKDGYYDIDQGIGIRAISGEKTGFSYTNQIDIKSLARSAQIARSIVDNVNHTNSKKFRKIKKTSIYSNINPLKNMLNKEKIDILNYINKIVRETDKRVKDVLINLNGVYEMILVAATDGTLATDIRPLVRLSINVLVEDNGKREKGFAGGGGRFGYEWFINNPINGLKKIDMWAQEAVRIALVNLYASSAPTGKMPVVLGCGWPGIMLHEAVGHGLEGEFNRYGISAFSNKIGEIVASKLCTVVDDGSIVNHRGSVAIDDEGTPGQCNILIEKGILRKYMHDKLNAKLMGVTPTGNGRRESYAHLPMPRMTNTFLLKGESTPQEIIESVDYGIYALNFSGGQVDITSGKFVFSTSEAYLINKGKITNAIKGVTLIGSGIEVMKNISMIGNDLEFDSGIGTCSKNGQNVPVGVGQPTLKIESLTVGGTE